MGVSRADRRREREPRVRVLFDDADVAGALDLLELVEYAWHDCYGEVSPSEDLIDDVLALSEGTLRGLILHARAAVIDWRDVRLAADARRRDGGTGSSRSVNCLPDRLMKLGDRMHSPDRTGS